jgi:hypothetical protein
MVLSRAANYISDSAEASKYLANYFGSIFACFITQKIHYSLMRVFIKYAPDTEILPPMPHWHASFYFFALPLVELW